MKIKTINSILAKKFDDFAASIEDKTVRDLVKQNTIITGGAIASMLLGEPVSDFDLYFRDKETVWAVANYYIDRVENNGAFVLGGGFSDTKRHIEFISIMEKRAEDLKKKGESAEREIDEINLLEQYKNDPDRIRIFIKSKGYIGDLPDEDEVDFDDGSEKPEPEARKPYDIAYVSSNAITLTHKIQLVIRFFGDPDTIHENYDFVHCMNYWTSWDRKVVTRKEALEALLAKELVYVGSKYPLCSIFRTRKFIQRQWTVNAGQYLKMAMQLNDMDLTRLPVLEDQLVGVDAHFFLTMIDALRRKDKEAVDRQYLTEIINKVFGGETLGTEEE